MYPGSTVVEQTARNPKIEGSNPTTGIGREKMVESYIMFLVAIFHLV
jgi:hypothetical protein